MCQAQVQVASVAGSYCSARRPVGDIWALVAASQLKWWAAHISRHMCCSDMFQEQDSLRGESFFPSFHTLNPSSCKSRVFRWFCVICFPSHQFLSVPALLPQTAWIVHSTAPEPRSTAEPGQIPVLLNFSAFLFSAFMTVLKSFPRFTGILLFLFLSFSQFPSFLGLDCQHFCTAAFLGALCLNEPPWSLAYVYMAWSPSTQCALLMLFHHTFEARQLPCLLWGFWSDSEIVSNYSLALIPVCALFSSALPNTSVQRIVPASHI